jgi:Hemerythrin HHE cation binding domain
MSGPITTFLAADHRRLEQLLARATAAGDAIDLGPYAEFRTGLLRHIAMEEKVLLPAAQRLRAGAPLPLAARLRADHGAIAALLVPPPTPAVVAALRAVLERHNGVEEGAGGLYEVCDLLVAAEADAIVAALRDVPAVPASPHNNEPRVLDAVRRAISRAGYDFDTLVRAGRS